MNAAEGEREPGLWMPECWLGAQGPSRFLLNGVVTRSAAELHAEAEPAPRTGPDLLEGTSGTGTVAYGMVRTSWGWKDREVNEELSRQGR